MTAVVSERVDPPVDEAVIVFCPVCCTPTDGISSQVVFVCSVCGQEWTMVIDLGRVASHSPA